MNSVDELLRFIQRIVSDARLKPIHLSVAVVLCNVWIGNHFEQPYRISRSKIMKASRIRSYATYHKVIKELDSWGYVSYQPSYHPEKGSSINLLVTS